MIQAQAPGKVMLSGEYAVLHGAPAVMMAIDSMAKVSICAFKGGQIKLRAANIGINEAYASIDHGVLEWHEVSAQDKKKLQLVRAVLNFFITRFNLNQGLNLDLDTSEFYAADGNKRGLGSSAALTVALVGGLYAYLGQGRLDMDDLIDIHRQIQDGRGSGADIAASLHGGLLSYRLQAGQPVTEPLDWPPDLCWYVLATGKAFSTGGALQTMALWQSRHPDMFSAKLKVLQDKAQHVMHALQQADNPSFLDHVRNYYAQVGQLGKISGVDILSRQHRRLLELGDEYGVVYKSCGAGGGDVGIVLSDNRASIEPFLNAASDLGFVHLPVHAQTSGLTVTSVDGGEKYGECQNE